MDRPPSIGETDGARARRVEVILSELEQLPTLGSVAIRLLELTTDGDADVREIVRLVESDPALSARVLALCRCHPRGRASDCATVEKAVLLLGFEAVRGAVLAVQVFDVLDGIPSPAGERPSRTPAFDREAYWLHCIAVAVVAEELARRGMLTREVDPGTAFVAGLLHDLGQLVLHVLLPESFDRVCQVTETHSASLDGACRQIIGVDTHTVGKRLGEQWGLPPSLVDVIWLNGQAFDALPASADRTLVSVVTLADALVRGRYITSSAHWARSESLTTLAIPVGIGSDELDELTAELHDRVTGRAAALGLNIEHNPEILLRAISRANKSLSRANAGMRQRESVARGQTRLIKAITAFHESLAPGAPVLEVVGRITTTCRQHLDLAPVFACFQVESDGGWQFVECGPDGKPVRVRSIAAPPDALPLSTVACDMGSDTPISVLMPWIGEETGIDAPLEALRTFPVPGEHGGTTILAFDARERKLPGREEMDGLVDTWRAALAAGALQEGVASTAEQLAQANRALQEIQEQMARHRTMATLGEVAAGAAHEMNNPLTVISGRAQLLVGKLDDDQLRRTAIEITRQSDKLSGMISALRSFAEPVVPERAAVDVANLVLRAVQQFGPQERRTPEVNTLFLEQLPKALVDGDLLTTALGELVRNAVESKGSKHIELRVATDPLDDQLRIEVKDDGAGLSEHALRHAFDPFYSEKPAGRQPGLGLARANRYVEAHGGRIALVNAPGGGAVATIWIPDWRVPDEAELAPARKSA